MGSDTRLAPLEHGKEKKNRQRHTPGALLSWNSISNATLLLFNFPIKVFEYAYISNDTFLVTYRLNSNLPHKHNPDNGSWQCWEWNGWKLAKHLRMHFHHGNTALISAKRMFMLAMPPTTFHLISSDGFFFFFFESEIWKGLSQKDDTHCTSKEGKRQLIWRTIQVTACNALKNLRERNLQTWSYNYSESAFLSVA